MKWQGPDLTQKKWGKSATQLDVVLSLKYSPPRSLSLLRFSHCQSFCHVSVTICQSFILCLFSIRVNKKLRLSKQFLWSPAESFYSISSSGLNLFFFIFKFMKNSICRCNVLWTSEYLQVLTTTWMQAWGVITSILHCTPESWTHQIEALTYSLLDEKRQTRNLQIKYRKCTEWKSITF